MIRLIFLPVALLAVLLAATAAHADWMNLTGAETAPNIAEIYVQDDQVRVVLEVYIGDLEQFEALVPDDWLQDSDPQRPPVEERLRRFSDTGLQFVTGTGEKLQARLERVEPHLRVDRQSPFAGMINPMTRRLVPDAPADKRVLYVELVYPFSEKPRQLTIVPPLDDEGRPVASIGFIGYHKSVPVIDFRYLGAPAQLTLDWDDPWYSRFDNPNLKRHHKSALMSFLYVEPYEVRHEILTRVRDLKAWMDLGLRGDEYIEVDELEPLKQRIGEFLLGRNRVLVDREALKPILDRTNYVKVALTGIQLMEKPERLEIATAIVGVIITYVTDGMPQEVTVDWDLFTDQVQRVPATATDPAGPLPTFLTPDDRVHRWTNYLKKFRMPTVQTVAVESWLGEIGIPWVTVICGLLALPVVLWVVRRNRRGQSTMLPLTGLAVLAIAGALAWPIARVTLARPPAIAGELQPAQAKELLQVLLKNVYRAFDFRDEGDVYDKLSLSVSGDLLTDIYLQNRRSFSIQKAGGAQARIQSVEIQDAVAERLDDQPLAYAIKGNWTAQGTVGHWGHVHTRRNRYDAVVTVEAVDGAWKITDLEVLEEQRVSPTPGSATGPGSAAATAQRPDPR
ncbi:MAG: hypothetical protein U9R74_18720 [Pseudomonadota bacterium]|nr:hypothetical protein [Pseudomonadota bacterium]